MAEKKTKQSEEKIEAEGMANEAEPEGQVTESTEQESVAEVAPEVEPVADAEPAAEPEAELATEAQPEPAADAEPEVSEEPVAEPVAEATTEPETAPQVEPAPPAPVKKVRSGRHVPRSERRKRPAKEWAKKPGKAVRNAIVRLPKPETEQGGRQERRGVVVSAAMDKTVVVKVDTLKAHPKYRKVVRRSKKFHAHDELNSAKIGDVVRIIETRPMSATKRWRVIEIVEAAK